MKPSQATSYSPKQQVIGTIKSVIQVLLFPFQR